MENKDVFTKIMTVLGTILIWFPVLAPFILGLASLIRDGQFLFDYLMPAELFVSALIGGILLLWASMRAHLYRKLIGWGLGIAVILLFGGQALSVVTGLASGETEPTPMLIVLVLTPILIYAVSLAVVGIGGILLARDLFKHHAY